MPDTRVRVLVVDDDPETSGALRQALADGGALVIAEAASAREGLELARHYAPDIVFVDPRAGEVDGVAVIEALGAMDMGIRPVLLGASLDPDEGLAAIRRGARGYLSKSDLLTDAAPRVLAAVMADELVCSRQMITTIVDRLVRSPQLGLGYRPVRSPLTSREWEVLDLLSVGRSTNEIAGDLVISRETVRTHVKHLMRKLGARSRAQLIANAGRLRGQGAPD